MQLNDQTVLFQTSQFYLIFVSASHQTGLDPEVNYSGSLGKGKVGHELKLELCLTMLVINSQCNVGLMNLPGHGPKSGSKHVCLIVALTGPWGQVLYKGDKGVNDAVCPPEGGSAEARDLLATSLPDSLLNS